MKQMAHRHPDLPDECEHCKAERQLVVWPDDQAPMPIDFIAAVGVLIAVWIVLVLFLR